jgi:hypothetical protein
MFSSTQESSRLVERMCGDPDFTKWLWSPAWGSHVPCPLVSEPRAAKCVSPPHAPPELTWPDFYWHLTSPQPSRHHAHRRRHPHAPTSTRNDIHWKCDGKSSGSGISKKNPEDIVLCEAELSLHLSPHHLSSRRGLDRGLQLSAAPGVIHTALSVHGNVVYSTRGDGRASGGLVYE